MTSTTEKLSLETVVHEPKGTLKQRRRRLRWRSRLEIAVAIATPVVLMALWEIMVAAGRIDRSVFPPPSQILTAAQELIANGQLWTDTRATLLRVLAGYGGGIIVGYTVGILMGTIRFLRRALEPMLSAIYTVPKIALLPIFLTILGFGDAPLVAIVSVTVFFYVWIDTMESVSSVPHGFREAADSLNVSRFQMFWHVLFPATLPQFFVVLRLTMGLSVLVIVAAEFVVGQDGLGYLIFHSRELYLLDQTYVGIVTVALLGVILQGIVTLLAHWGTPWSEKHGRAQAL